MIGFVGLGRMGNNMVLNLLDKKKKVVAYNRSPEKVKKIAKRGAIPSYSIEEMFSKLGDKNRIIWLMVPAGKPVDEILNEMRDFLKRGDIIIDGGNSYYKDSINRAKMLEKKGVYFLDVGTSGGISGARHGACMMVGGNKKSFEKIEPYVKAMCVKEGYGYMGKSGAGHFVKMVHNGIEYGMMGSIAEGIQTIENYSGELGVNLNEVVKVYSHGSIIESRLMSWLEEAWKEDPKLKKILGSVPIGETEKEMKKLEGHGKSSTKILKQARKMRVISRRKGSLSGKIISAMRNKFGGHKVNPKRTK